MLKVRLAASCLMGFAFLGTTFIPEQEDVLVQEADRICAVEIVSERAGPANAEPTTLLKARPLECFKGSSSLKDFEISIPGGTSQALNSSGEKIIVKRFIPSAPRLMKNTQYVLYLAKGPEAASPYVLLSWAQGISKIKKDPQTKDWKFEEPKLRSQLANSKALNSAAAPKAIRSLKDFKVFVSDVLKTRAK